VVVTVTMTKILMKVGLQVIPMSEVAVVAVVLPLAAVVPPLASVVPPLAAVVTPLAAVIPHLHPRSSNHLQADNLRSGQQVIHQDDAQHNDS